MLLCGPSRITWGVSSGHQAITWHDEQEEVADPQSVFSKEDVWRIIEHICTRLHNIRCTSQGFDLTPYMCDEPKRIWAHMHSGGHGMTAYLRAHEYMILSLLMPYVLTEVYEPEMRWMQDQFDGEPSDDMADKLRADPMPSIVKAWYMYMDFFCFMRKQIMTESEVCALEDKGRNLQRFLWYALPDKAGQKMGWHFLKMHHIDTFAASKRFYGSLECISTQPTEHCHVYYSHKLIGLTNGKDAFGQIMHFVVRSHVLRDLTMFNGEHGNSMLKDFESHNFSRSQMYSYPIDLLYRQPDKVKRVLSAEMRDHSGSGTKIRYKRLSAFAAPDGETLWGARHPGFMFLPHLLGSFLVTRRNRFGLQLDGLEKVCASLFGAALYLYVMHVHDELDESLCRHHRVLGNRLMGHVQCNKPTRLSSATVCWAPCQEATVRLTRRLHSTGGIQTKIMSRYGPATCRCLLSS